VRWARNGATGSFLATYKVSAGPKGWGAPSGTLVVAQRVERGTLAWPTHHGSSSYVFTTSSGRLLQWIEKGTTSWDGFRLSSTKPLDCYGPARYGYSHGWIYSVMPFVNGEAHQSIANAVKTAEADPAQLSQPTLSVKSGPPRGFQRCLRISAKAGGPATWCLDYEGFLVSETVENGSPTLDGVASLLRRGPPAPLRRSRSWGRAGPGTGPSSCCPASSGWPTRAPSGGEGDLGRTSLGRRGGPFSPRTDDA
jgi:hypothetical protein